MALAKKKLESGLKSVYEKGKKGNAFPGAVGHKTAKEYMKYMQDAQNVFGLPFQGMTGASVLGGDLAQIYSRESLSGEETARKMATAFDKCIATLLTQHQTTIVSVAFKPLAYTYLNIYLNKPAKTASEFAKNLAMALHLATTAPAIIVSGIIPGAPPVPFAGPIT